MMRGKKTQFLPLSVLLAATIVSASTWACEFVRNQTMNVTVNQAEICENHKRGPKHRPLLTRSICRSECVPLLGGQALKPIWRENSDQRLRSETARHKVSGLSCKTKTKGSSGLLSPQIKHVWWFGAFFFFSFALLFHSPIDRFRLSLFPSSELITVRMTVKHSFSYIYHHRKVNSGMIDWNSVYSECLRIDAEIVCREKLVPKHGHRTRVK